MTPTDYRLPENAEASLLGCVLLCPDVKPQVAKLITEDDFSSPVYAAMFASAMEMEEPDAVVFREGVKRRGYELPEGFFNALGDIAFSRWNVELYAELLHEDARKRKLLDLATKIQESVVGQDEAADIIADATTRLREIEVGGTTSEVATPDEAAKAFFEHRRLVESGKGAVPTGFEPLDGILGGGMLRSGLYVLAARPGMGKTTFGIQIADSIANAGGNVLFVSLEMAVEQIEAKRIARLTGLSSNAILLGDGNSLDYKTVLNATKELRKLPVYISRRPSATVAQIRRMAKQVPEVQCVVVDYLGKIAPSDPRSSRYEAVTAISGDLKTLAVELGVPVLALAQLNRENTGRTDKRPQLSDLRDSGAVEQDADGVIMLHRSDYYETSDQPLQPWEAVDLEIIVRKNRHGQIGNCLAGFFPATGLIVKRG